MTADFAQLYAQLGLRADCSLEAFKHACRRRIAELHPDRLATDAVADGTQIPLDELLALYAKAMRFHHRHGRLPGAVPLSVAPEMSGAMQVSDTVASSIAATDVRNIWFRNPLFVVLCGVVVLAVLGFWGDGPPTPQRQARISIPAVAPEADVEPTGDRLEPGMLELGMDRADVLAIQGEPLRRNEFEWEYGPSWLRFERNRLVDWHSSPLHPLKTATASPPPETDPP